jgi:threonine dehydratase
MILGLHHNGMGMAAAILMLLEQEKTLAEGAGAIGLAALLKGRRGTAANRLRCWYPEAIPM